jgi:hypothetical protein
MMFLRIILSLHININDYDMFEDRYFRRENVVEIDAAGCCWHRSNKVGKCYT